MRCVCESQRTNKLLVMADVGADPIWCQRCICNLDLEMIPLETDLKAELVKWIAGYGVWINWEEGRIVSNGVALEEAHNNIGKKLACKVQEALSGTYEVSFSPSTYAKEYENL